MEKHQPKKVEISHFCVHAMDIVSGFLKYFTSIFFLKKRGCCVANRKKRVVLSKLMDFEV